MQSSKGRLFWAVSLGHAANDMFMSLRSVLLAFISAYILPMTGGQVGLAVSAVELSGALSQPFFGWLADKTGGRLLGAIGVAWTVTFMLLGLAVVMLGGSYWLMVIPLMLAGLGSGAFHPVGSMHAVDVDPSRAGRNAALFFMFGQLGLGIGPALAGLLLNNAHTRNNEIFGAALGPSFAGKLLERGTVLPVFILAVLAIPAVFLMAFTIPGRKAYRSAAAAKATTTAVTTEAAPIPRGPLALLIAAVSLRALGSLSIVAFMPLMFQSKGWSPAEYGALTSAFWIASGIAGITFGTLGDRYDRRKIITLSLLIAVPGIFILPDLNGVMAYIIAILVGAMSGSHSLIVVQAQSLFPGRKGFASGMILGMIFATGAVGNLIVGNWIDTYGLATAFHLVAALTLIGSFLWLCLPAKTEAPVVVPLATAEVVEQLA